MLFGIYLLVPAVWLRLVSRASRTQWVREGLVFPDHLAILPILAMASAPGTALENEPPWRLLAPFVCFLAPMAACSSFDAPSSTGNRFTACSTRPERHDAFIIHRALMVDLGIGNARSDVATRIGYEHADGL